MNPATEPSRSPTTEPVPADGAARRSPWRWLPWAVASLALLVTVWLWLDAAADRRLEQRRRLDERTELARAQITQRMQHDIDVLWAFQALFRDRDALVRRTQGTAFRTLWRDLGIDATSPAVVAVQFAQWVDEEDRAAVEAAVRRDSYPAFRIRPVGSPAPARYFPVLFSEPLAGNEAALGFDLASEPQRFAPVERSRDGGRPVLSGPLRLLQGGPGLVLRTSIYREGAATSTVEQRRAAHDGQVSLVLRADRLLQGAVAAVPSGSALRLSDLGADDQPAGSPARVAQLGDAPSADATASGPQAGAVLRGVRDWTVAGRRWRIEAIEPAIEPLLLPSSLGLLAAGIVVCGALGALVHAIQQGVGRQARALARQSASARQSRAEAERSAAELRAMHRLNEAVFTQAAVGLVTLDAAGRVRTMNPAATALFGDAALQVGEPLAAQLDRPGTERVATALQELAAGDRLEAPTQQQDVADAPAVDARRALCEVSVARDDGSERAVDLTLSRLDDGSGGLAGYLCVAADATRRVAAAARLSKLAFQDVLTGLANRAHLHRRLQEALQEAGRGDGGIALAFIDLDGFKEINDTHGHAVGDDLLRNVAMRLASAVRDGDLLARLGGDEFVVLSRQVDSEFAARRVMQRLQATLDEPIAIGALRIRARASVGMARYPVDGRDAATLLAVADRAMYVDKQARRGERSGREVTDSAMGAPSR